MTKQEKFDKLVCITSALNDLIKSTTDVKSVGVELYKNGDIDRIEMMSLDDIDDYLDSIFETHIIDA